MAAHPAATAQVTSCKEGEGRCVPEAWQATPAMVQSEGVEKEAGRKNSEEWGGVGYCGMGEEGEGRQAKKGSGKKGWCEDWFWR